METLCLLKRLKLDAGIGTRWGGERKDVVLKGFAQIWKGGHVSSV